MPVPESKAHLPKSKILDRKFFTELSQKVYNPKTKRFLRLCNGSLTNGPDPVNKNRKMHCGLGELFYAMTGHHTGTLTEDDVTEYALDHLVTRIDKTRKIYAIRAAMDGLPYRVVDNIECCLEDIHLAHHEEKIKHILCDMPSKNDDPGHCLIGKGEDKEYRNRAKAIAADFMAIARLLPGPAKKKAKKRRA